ncbi:MAG: DivIVA domain-containing protein [Deltaproteobacteria bacterium]|jgi:cell division initiation protein|nr:DivIVA domain-containing protein [Deltaproteobacteria bacterium]MCL5880104.1 DivIVA domain-containing protein [Deltaproteobacteria bacterium]MDA8304845.1 DivIVA domain-containing protein [Deltaproteobacteria bacterium]
MELSPLEIRSQKFSKKIKGYDVTEVENFLDIVSKDLEKLYGEYYNLKEELVKKNQEIADYKEKDKSISEAILMVQSVSSDIKKAAISEAESIKNNALIDAKKIIGGANAKYIEIVNNINDLLNKRLIIISSIKNLLSTNINLIEQEARRKVEISFIPEQAKFENAGNIENNNENDNENNLKEPAEPVSAPEQKAEKIQENIEQEHDELFEMDNEMHSDNKPEEKNIRKDLEKDLDELLKGVNKFSI